MTKTDTTRKAVRKSAAEQYQDFVDAIRYGDRVIVHKKNALGEMDSECFPPSALANLSTLLTERDALQARAERAEAGLAAVREKLDALDKSVCVERRGAAYMIREGLAQLDAEPAGVSEPGQTHREGQEQEND